MNKRILFVIALSTLGNAGAAAEEMSTAPSLYITGPTTSLPWSGFFIGGNGGFGWSHSSVAYSANDPAATAGTCGGVGHGQCIPSTDFLLHGATAGGQIGYDWQISSLWLVGIETDYQWSDFRSSGSSPFHLGNVGNTNMVVSETVQSFGTLRLRMGVLPTRSFLFYGTAGLAYGQVHDSLNVANPLTAGTGSESLSGFSYSCSAGGPSCFAGTTSATEVGWTIGGGGEFRITNNLTFKSEILYVQFDAPNGNASAQTTLPGTTAASFAAAFPTVRLVIARGGFNFRF